MYSKKLKEAELGFTYDDFLLVPNASYTEAKDVDTKAKVSRNFELNIPIISSAMDTVTESDMAIALAQEGGLGVIHRNMTLEQQVKEVKKVKMSGDLTIKDVVTITPNSSISTVKTIMEEEEVSGLPVIKDEKLVGIISKRDIKPFLNNNSDKKVEDIMTSDVVTIEEPITPSEALELAYENKVERLPVIRDGKLAGIVTIRDILNHKKYPNAARDKNGNFLVAAAAGPFDLERAMALDEAGADIIAVDCAHAHNMNVVKFAKTMKENLDADLIMGNIATSEAAEDLIAQGIDGLKVGIGPGSMCTTRIIAGVGVPQLSAISSVADVASDYGVPVIADGGLRYSGDIAKALGAGADLVMLGNLLAGTYESPGDVVVMNGRKYKQYRGMGSMGAMTGGFGGGADRYFQEIKGPMKHSKLVPEGVEGAVPYKGTVNEVVFQLVGGLKASMGYCGAKDIKSMQEVAKFVRITSSGIKESHPHDLLITNESPNYPTLD
ncbi:MAG: IMP dehydrogenase [Methanobrevibacter arboriphilus]|uniref:Inosine-5'-monophosphate dehydrogenase n=2 Tax=Methanobrevibacter arboriphilus TaxID=39441 RepID=A0A843AFY2_METAZ|nr:IMP dehydrogenase [Methanobrevibacter arboriphilus]MBF4468681.1 IMP dehydrogenase [Methanobrevibacter arboriphilus]MCC7562100.1 IMP dehydrogenase [Methanobrevibacter arboriphilus]BBL60999.1 IMP dehydrogenase [Methanobrevibacter arboriphilus]GLI12816.1 IMP dehydrogenase [Methanobrevibacter arboriphilus]